MSIWSFLGIAGESAEEERQEPETIRKIARALRGMPRDKARFLAAFAYVLGRVAHADQEISEEETAKMVEMVRRQGLPESQAVLVVEIAQAQNELFGGTESFVVTKELSAAAAPAEREALLDCLFAVSAADEEISAEEESRIRQIADELGFSHSEYVTARSRWSEHRSVMKALKERL